MAETWPITLQDTINEAGFSFQFGETAIRTSVDVGPSKVRRRFTKAIDTLRATINITTSQYSTFYSFYDTTLNGGVNTFNYNHPITGVETEFRFLETPQVTPLGGGNFSLNMAWEVVP